MVTELDAHSVQRDADVRAEPDTRIHRVNVNFTGEAYEALAEIARTQGKSMSEVLRDALTLEKWLLDERRNGGRILLERNGQTREILWR